MVGCPACNKCGAGRNHQGQDIFAKCGNSDALPSEEVDSIAERAGSLTEAMLLARRGSC